MRTLLALAVVLTCAACSSSNSAPSGRTMTGSPVRPSGPVQGPGGVTARWAPDLNWTHGRHVVTHGSPASAAALQHDIATSKPFPRGAFACPMDSGVAVRLSLRLGSGGSRDVVHLTGCQTVTWPGHRPRVVSAALRRDLATIAPTRWQQYLDG